MSQASKQESLELCIVMPAYNEEGCIARVVGSWLQLSRLIDTEVKLVVVNDGSKDRTGQILEDLSKKHPQLVVVTQPNAGHGKALVNGYCKALDLGARWVFQTDSDDQFRAQDFPQLWEKRDLSKFVTGRRKNRHDPLHRLVITRILRGLINALYSVDLKDSNVPFRLIRADYLRALLKALPSDAPFAPNIFIAVLAKKDGQELFEIPISHAERKLGQSPLSNGVYSKFVFRVLGSL